MWKDKPPVTTDDLKNAIEEMNEYWSYYHEMPKTKILAMLHMIVAYLATSHSEPSPPGTNLLDDR